jgi:hypothetical protein
MLIFTSKISRRKKKCKLKQVKLFGGMRNAYEFWLGNWKRRDHSGDLIVTRMI